MANKFRKGDQIIVISGSQKSKIGKITSITGDRVLVDGVNLVTIHKKPTSSSPGERLKVEKSIHISNISHVEDGVASRVKYIISENAAKPFKAKQRVYKKTGKKLV